MVAEIIRPTRHALCFEDYLVALDSETTRLRSVLEGADPETPVPTCPGWTLTDLAAHVGRLHRWVNETLRRRSRVRIDFREAGAPPATWGEYDDWLATGCADLTARLRADGPDVDVWIWTKARHGSLAWARRMLHETAIHRADAELALGGYPVVDPLVAADGIDELLDALPHAAYFSPGVRELTGDGETLHWHATDTPPDDRAEWLITLEADGYRWTRAHARGAVAVRATVSDLYLFAYARRTAHDPEIEVIGDTALLAHWVSHAILG